MPKRKYFWIRCISFSLIYALAVVFLNTKGVMRSMTLGWLNLYFLVFIVLIFFGLFLCFRIRIKYAFFFGLSGYLMQHLYDRLYYLILSFFDSNLPTVVNNIIAYALFIILLVLSYFLFTRRTKNERMTALTERTNNILFVILMVVSFSVVYLLSCYMMFGERQDTKSVKVYGILLCVILLFTLYGIFDVDILARDKKTLEKIIESNQKNSKLSDESLKIINMKLHDVKNIFEKYDNDPQNKEFLLELKNAVQNYDNTFQYNNEVLQTVVIETNLRCLEENVYFSVMVDESKLDIFSKADLFSLLGNALNNALEAVLNVDEKDSRFIKFSISSKGKMLTIHVENSFVKESLLLNGKNIVTSKQDKVNHGIGLKSIQYITGKYKGIFDYQVDGNIFILNLLFPLD
ncbi:MAG: ATP-binding protein [Bacillales bacterium]|nr:ATP-binding protein [Bacillales bacterium]